MTKKLKYDFYQVVMPRDSRFNFGAVLNQINTLQGRARLYSAGDYPIRLQGLIQGASDFLGDIARIRMNDIPDKMKLSGETAPLALDEDEGLGEIASFIYHPVTNTIMMMRNRNAVSISGLINYVEYLGNVEGIEFKHVLQVEAYQRLQRLVTIQKLEIEVAAPGNGTIFRDLGLAPQMALDLMGSSPRVRLSLTFSTGYDRERSLPREVIERIVTEFRARNQLSADERQHQQTDDESMDLVVSGREDTHQKEVIDLFADILTDTYDVNIRDQRTITYMQRHQATRAVWARHRDRLMQLFAQPGEA